MNILGNKNAMAGAHLGSAASLSNKTRHSISFHHCHHFVFIGLGKNKEVLRHCLHFDDVITFSLFRSGLQKKNSRKNTQGASTHGRQLTIFERREGEKRVLSRGPRAISRNVGTELRKCP